MSDTEKPPYRRQILDDLFDTYTILSRGAYVSLYDAVGHMTRYSPAYVELFDLPGEYVPHGQDKWSELIHPEDLGRYETVMFKLFSGAQRYCDLHYRVRLKDGSYSLMRFIGSILRDEKGTPEIIGGITINEGLMENTDTVTVLRNQYGFFQDLTAVMELQKKCTLLMIGVSRMSELNEIHGYSYGNRVLQQIAWFLQENIGQYGTIYRLDGAKFAFITEQLTPEQVAEHYEKIRQSLLNGLQVDAIRQNIVSSGGMISITGKSVDERTIFAALIYTCRESRIHKNGRIVSFDGSLEHNDHESLEVIDEIRNSILLDCAGFSLNYQTIVDARTEGIVGVKAIVNWHSEHYGDVPAEEYLPALERDFVFEELGYWILRQAMLNGKKLLEKNPRLLISVSVMQVQLEDEFFIDELQKIADQTKFPLDNLCFELSRGCRLLNSTFLRNIVAVLRSRWIKITLDDFGSGLASIDFLRELSPDYIKFDEKYAHEFDKHENRQIVRCLSELAAALNTKVLIEGVDSQHIRDELKNFPVTNFQGEFFTPPLPLDEILKKF
ncbi:MAG: EAL domain-containing protein [Selenomonadaceae bacterium]|nr:EAL domain-containing protein [Selenomonadaceae bacterium]